MPRSSANNRHAEPVTPSPGTENGLHPVDHLSPVETEALALATLLPEPPPPSPCSERLPGGQASTLNGAGGRAFLSKIVEAGFE